MFSVSNTSECPSYLKAGLMTPKPLINESFVRNCDHLTFLRNMTGCLWVCVLELRKWEDATRKALDKGKKIKDSRKMGQLKILLNLQPRYFPICI
jgi:hypothetical protein